jgi:3-hydroxyisobutyrate dehydrogenase-like beta-hydroxyacid dehydrogenase
VINDQERHMKESIGLVGLGNMGAALAERLLPAYEVVGFDLDPRRRNHAAELGVTIAEGAAEIASRTRTVLLSLPHPKASQATVAEIAGAKGQAELVIETSTVTPADARGMSATCLAAGISYIDAAILSGTKSVVAGATLLLVGGPEETVQKAGAVLDAVTSNRRWLGDVGSGMAAKVINNAVAHDVYVVLSEAAAMGKANGISIATLVDMLADPEGGLIRPLTHRIAERLADEDYVGGMPVEAARKDSLLALELAQTSGVPLFVTQAAHTVYEIAAATGMGRLDYSVVATLWDTWRTDGS